MYKQILVTFIGILLLTCSIPAFAQEVLYTEDFESGATEGWELEPGWRMEQKEGNFVLNGEGHNWARLQRGQDWADYTFRSRIKVIRGGIHLNYRVSEKGRYFIGFSEEGLYLNKETPWGKFFELAKSDARIGINTWHDIEIRGKGGHLQVYLDGKLEIDFTDNAPITQGSIAFETLEESYAQIDNVESASISTAISETDGAINLDLINIGELWIEGLKLAVGEQAQELFSSAEDVYHKAILQIEKGAVDEAEHLVKEAESIYREAIIIGLRQGLLEITEKNLKEGNTNITLDNLEKSRQLYKQASDRNISTKEFLKLIKKIQWELASMTYPDLTVELWSVPESQKKLSHKKWISPYPPTPDQPAIISIIVKNIGLEPVDKKFNIELYVDKKLEKTWTWSPILEMEDDYHKKNLMMPGETQVYEFAKKFSAGKHTFHWKVDTKNNISESDESKKSNELEATAIWVAPSDLPDLIVKDITHADELIVGQDTKWKITIKNNGKTDVDSPFLTTLDTGGVQFGSFWLNSLAAGASKTFETTQSSSIAGTESITGTVDVGGVIPETNEANNKKVIPFTTSYVDLEVGTVLVKTNKSAIHEPVTISFQIKNNGLGNVTKPFKIGVFPGKVVQGKTQATSFTFPKNKLPLKAGASIDLEHKVTLSYPGNYQAWVMADFPDPDFVYNEKEKANNTKTSKGFSLKETYYVKIDKIKYTSSCKNGFEVWLDRSGGYWKGDVVLQLFYNGKLKSEKALLPDESKAYFKENTFDVGFADNKELKIYNGTLETHAKVGGQLIQSSSPAKVIDVWDWPQPKINSISPDYALRGQKNNITINGKDLTTPKGLTNVTIAHMQPGALSPDNEVTEKVLKTSSSVVVTELDVSNSVQLGKRGLWIDACSYADCRDCFEIVSQPPSPTKPSEPKKPPVCNKPDLYILGSVWLEPTNNPSPGQKFTFYCTLMNIGNALAPASKAKVILTGGGKELQSKIITIPKLKAKQPYKVSWAFNNGLPKGKYTFNYYKITITLDYNKAIQECNENNWTDISFGVY
ncbi:MAG: DUF1080 domain-containing protein [Proteobacteria bacterium]|nr:DUF1080 domain-containing protein [Pseudomonadota bacterium]